MGAAEHPLVIGPLEVVPIVLTTIPSSAGLPGTTQIFDIVFVLVVVSPCSKRRVCPGSPAVSA